MLKIKPVLKYMTELLGKYLKGLLCQKEELFSESALRPMLASGPSADPG